ncbi:MAG TPA: SDR family NAD(P)-dependent oxidoreductase, partial [Bryocella sp.]|nr:SDR family NAD(P)-dependent oxidoreductase [Bryocella sp.]
MAGVEGRIALVTGASQGIGRACALLLAESGAKLALCARNQEKLEQVAGEIRAKGGEAEAFPLDVSNEEAIKATVKAVVARFGKLDILINNAGITRDQLVMRMRRTDWDDVLATNLTAPFLLTQAAIGSMLKQRWGRIINITSIFGQIGQAGQSNYSSSKAGLIGLTMAVAREVASRHITSNAVAPGFIETAMTEVLPSELKENLLKS